MSAATTNTTKICKVEIAFYNMYIGFLLMPSPIHSSDLSNKCILHVQESANKCTHDFD